MIITCIACAVCFYAGQKVVRFMDSSLRKDLKERNDELLALNQELTNRLKKGSHSTSKTADSQFTQKELVLLRNLIHPDKHKNSNKATEMFVKVDSLITK